MNSHNKIKIIFLGNVGIGKTCLIVSYQGGSFIEHPSTLGTTPSYSKIKINDKEYNLTILDTSGQERFFSMTKNFIATADIIILVFSVTDKDSFKALNYWYENVYEIKGNDGYLIGVAGNKLDLLKEVDDIRSIEKKMISFSNKIKAEYSWTSAKENIGIKDLIKNLVTKFIEKYPKKLAEKRRTICLKANDLKKKEEEKKCCSQKKQRFNSSMSVSSTQEDISFDPFD